MTKRKHNWKERDHSRWFNCWLQMGFSLLICNTSLILIWNFEVADRDTFCITRVMTGPKWLQVPVNMRRLVRQEVLTNTRTNVASGLANVAGIFIWTLRSLFSYYGRTVYRLGSSKRLFTGIVLRKWIILWLGRTPHLTLEKLLRTSMPNSLMLAAFLKSPRLS